jgi:16S rRNA (adenine1518-N6/adenine1519-N6)-dimethyltransferase
MESVRAKKHLGQHFLTDKNTAGKIVGALRPNLGYDAVLEVGPGMGILSDLLLQETTYQTWMVDVDGESIEYLQAKYPQLGVRLIHGDFLTLDFNQHFPAQVAVIGNFPYHISSQILFKVLNERHKVPEVVGSKAYGILSVFIQAYYDTEYLFTVKAGAFNPPPKVLSGVIRLTRKQQLHLDCDEKLFWQIVKAAFNQRRKTLRNALSGVIQKVLMDEHPFWDLRAERLTVEDFVELTQLISKRKGG